MPRELVISLSHPFPSYILGPGDLVLGYERLQLGYNLKTRLSTNSPKQFQASANRPDQCEGKAVVCSV
jgi:hypothetical protein